MVTASLAYAIVEPLAGREAWNPLPFGAIRLRLPWPPSVNHAYFNKAGGGRGKSKKLRAFIGQVWASIYEQRIPRRFLSHPMRVTINQHARNGQGDCDNGVKCVLDTLVKSGVIADDNREIIRELVVRDGARAKTPYITVEIECLN